MEYVDNLPSDEESCYYAEHLEFHHNPALPPAFTDDELAQVVPHCPNIATALLGGIPDLSSRTLILLAEHAPRLAALDISGCSAVSDLGLHALATHATSLSALAISRIPGVTNRALAALVRGLPRLQELEMDALPLVSARGVRDVWTFARRLRRWTLAGCLHVTDGGFPSVRAPDGADADSPDGAEPGATGGATPPLVLPAAHTLGALHLVDLSHCARLTDAAVRGLVKHAPRVHELSLAGCGGLTDGALRAVAAGLGPHLRVLDLGGLLRVTDSGVCALVGACARLQAVDISCE